MGSKLAVIPGTFNPVTKAHVHMADIIARHMPESEIVFVPTKSNFLQSWKHMDTSEIFTDNMRAEMLALALKDTPYTWDLWEMGDSATGKTFDTLCHMAETRGIPRENVSWVCGSDKLGELHTWYRAADILSTFRLIVIGRNDDDPAGMIDANPFLVKYRSRIQVIDGTEEYLRVSSTLVRNAMDEGRLPTVRSLLCPKVYEYLENVQKEQKDSEE